MRKLSFILLILCSCAVAKPATYAGCEIVVRATDPALEPLCATAAEIADAIAQWIDQGGGRKATRPPTNDEIYQAIKARRQRATSSH